MDLGALKEFINEKHQEKNIDILFLKEPLNILSREFNLFMFQDSQRNYVEFPLFRKIINKNIGNGTRVMLGKSAFPMFLEVSENKAVFSAFDGNYTMEDAHHSQGWLTDDLTAFDNIVLIAVDRYYNEVIGILTANCRLCFSETVLAEILERNSKEYVCSEIERFLNTVKRTYDTFGFTVTCDNNGKNIEDAICVIMSNVGMLHVIAKTFRTNRFNPVLSHETVPDPKEFAAAICNEFLRDTIQTRGRLYESVRLIYQKLAGLRSGPDHVNSPYLADAPVVCNNNIRNFIIRSVERMKKTEEQQKRIIAVQLSTIIASFLKAGYEIRGDCFVKDVNIIPEFCYKGDQFFRILNDRITDKKEKFYVTKLFFKFSDILNGSISEVYANSYHPNIASHDTFHAGGRVCLGELADVADKYKKVTEDKRPEYIFSFLVNLEEMLNTINFDSCYFGKISPENLETIVDKKGERYSEHLLKKMSEVEKRDYSLEVEEV